MRLSAMAVRASYILLMWGGSQVAMHELSHALVRTVSAEVHSSFSYGGQRWGTI